MSCCGVRQRFGQANRVASSKNRQAAYEDRGTSKAACAFANGQVGVDTHDRGSTVWTSKKKATNRRKGGSSKLIKLKRR